MITEIQTVRSSLIIQEKISLTDIPVTEYECEYSVTDDVTTLKILIRGGPYGISNEYFSLETDVEFLYKEILKNTKCKFVPKIWKPSIHQSFRQSFRKMVFILLLINQRYDYIFPNEIILMIIDHMSKNYIPYQINTVSTRHMCCEINNIQKDQIVKSGISVLGDYILPTSESFEEDREKYNLIKSIIT